MQSYHLTDEFTDIVAEQASTSQPYAVSCVVLGPVGSPDAIPTPLEPGLGLDLSL